MEVQSLERSPEQLQECQESHADRLGQGIGVDLEIDLVEVLDSQIAAAEDMEVVAHGIAVDLKAAAEVVAGSVVLVAQTT